MIYFNFRHSFVVILFACEFFCTESKPECEIMIVDLETKIFEVSPKPKPIVTKESCIISVQTNGNPISVHSDAVQPNSIQPLKSQLAINPIDHLVNTNKVALTLKEEDRKLLLRDENIDQSLKQKLIDLFNGLNTELLEFTKFYDYYDVLTLIDKSIALIQQFECTPKINKSRNLMIRKKTIGVITLELKNLEELWTKVKSLHDIEIKKNEPKYKYMLDGLVEIKKRKEDLNKQFERYKKDDIYFKIEDYQKHDELKTPLLQQLRGDLEKIRKNICPVNEQDLQKNAELYNNSFKKKVSDIYENLVECHEKEKRSVKVLFDIYKNILKGIEEATARLNSFNEELGGPKSKVE